MLYCNFSLCHVRCCCKEVGFITSLECCTHQEVRVFIICFLKWEELFIGCFQNIMYVTQFYVSVIFGQVDISCIFFCSASHQNLRCDTCQSSFDSCHLMFFYVDDFTVAAFSNCLPGHYKVIICSDLFYIFYNLLRIMICSRLDSLYLFICHVSCNKYIFFADRRIYNEI